MKNILTAVVLALVGFAIGFSVAGTLKSTTTDKPSGGAAGPDHYGFESFHADAEIGGYVLATSSQGTATYTASNITNSKVIQHTATGALTVTLPASSTLTSFIPRAGDTRTLFINAITTNITLAGGTGTDLDTASTTKLVLVGGLTQLTFVRKTNTDIEVIMTSGI